MGVGLIHARDLDHFVAECDRLGGFGTPATTDYIADFEIRFDTPVNQALAPFSEEYFRQQELLHAELSSRPLGAAPSEHYPLPNIDHHVHGCNPYNLPDIRFVSQHARTIHTCLMLADLPPHSTILDMGAGWGLSSESMAFCGASVTAVDINPEFVQLLRRRAERLALPIEAVHSDFDSFHSDKTFDMIFFYECLHHSRRPWNTLRHLARFLKPEGKIVFAGEPINRFWWKHWGLRLDHQSVYCIRKHGWWESGWTKEFLTQCFDAAGLHLNLYDQVGLNKGMIGIAVRQEVADHIRPNVSLLQTPKFLERAKGKLRRMFSKRVQ